MKFPQDFKQELHHLIPRAKQWTLSNKEDKVVISIVGGGTGLYGNGVTTFEMYDFREEEPQSYLSKEDINNHLEINPI